jgi:periplasmic copper chaperone A
MRNAIFLACGLGAALASTSAEAAAPEAAASLIVPVAEAETSPIKIGALAIEGPWMRANPPGGTVAGGFLRITNAGSDADRLVGIVAPFADHVEIHQTKMVGDVMQMRQLTDGLAIGPGQTAEFKPGSYHLMFLGVKEPLKQGSRVKATLEFAKSGKVDVEFEVVAPGAGAPLDTRTH